MGKLPNRKKNLILTTLVVAVGVIAIRGTGVLQLLEWAAFDHFWRWRPNEVTDQRIVIVAINEAHIQKTAEWPISDARLAQLIKQIKLQKPAVIGLDLYRDLPVGNGAEQLQQQFANTANLFGIAKVTGDRIAAPPKLAQLGRYGFNDVLLDQDSKVRRALLSLETSKGKVSYSFSLILALAYLQRLGINPTSADSIKVGKASFEALHSNFGGYININDAGYQIMLSFRKSNCQAAKGCEPFLTVPIEDVLSDQIARDFFRDRIVLIGSTAESVKDQFFTPFSADQLNAAPGVEIHADIISQIVSSAIDGRVTFRDLAEPLEWLWILIWTGLGSVIAIQVLNNPKIAIIYLGINSLGLIAVTYLAFLFGWWIPLVPPLIALIAATLATTGVALLQNLNQYYLELASYLATLEQQVSDRTQALSQKNAQLEAEIHDRIYAEQTLQATLTRLQLTQSQLIESEKMAALGSLVAGVAHEINTPIGNSILAASTLVSEVRHFEQILKSGTIKRSLMEEYLMVATESSEIILNNLRRAGELVQSFKQVAVDRSSEELRWFAVKPYIEDILLSLEPKLKRTLHKVTILGDAKIAVISYPGVFSQVITNLVLNSLFHGYPDQNQRGNLIFEIVADAQNLTLRYLDDGCGIAPEFIGQIFNPFFTTARDRGGSGLGLHIVYNLVTQSLGGTIQVQSEVGRGTTFILFMPLQINQLGQDLATESNSNQVLAPEKMRSLSEK